MIVHGHAKIVYLIWATLIVATFTAIFLGRWSMGFVAVATLFVSIAPTVLAERYHINLPWTFFTGIVMFIFATLFLGEAFDFYERYWWWDILLHASSAVGFGLVGFVFVFALFEGDRYAAPAWAISFIAMCFAIAFGVAWEIFEYTMDQFFGLNMQKSGPLDTMWDLIVDAVGGFVGAFSGFGYLKGREKGGLQQVIAEFVRLNRGFFSKSNRRK